MRIGLLDAIERQRHKRLVLLHAPAGHGKTVLLTQWREHVQRSGAACIWVGLEKADSSVDHFVASVAAGLREAGWSRDADPQASRRGLMAEDPLDALMALVALSTRETWLILEDWHRAEADPITELLDALLRKCPVHWHVALSSRTKPRINLLALRAKGQVIEINHQDLRFSLDETHMLMAPVSLPSSAVEQLADFTEGWPIALQLAQLWLADDGEIGALRSSFLNAIDGMADFVAAEVFSTISTELQLFLLESSIFPRFNDELIDFVRERGDSDEMIETLRSLTGLTIATDSAREWHRHHRLFAEFLHRARRRLPKERIAQLHGRATLWFERRNMLFEAVEHARQSGNEARTVQLVEDAGCVDICIRNGAPAVRALLDSLPANAVRERPRLRAAYTAMNLKLGSIGQAGELLAELQAAIAEDGSDAVLRRDLLVVQNLRECFIDENPSLDDLIAHRRSLETFADADWWFRALLQNVLGRLEMRRGLLQEAVVSLLEADRIFDAGGSAQGQFFMLANLAICHVFLGKLEAAEGYLALAHAALERQLGDTQAYAGIVHTVEALLLYERNELPDAARAAQLALAGLELAEGCFEQYFSAIQIAARVAFAASGLDAAVRFIDRGRRLSRFHALARMEGLLDWLQLRLTIEAEQWDAAARLSDELASSSGPPAELGWMEHDLSRPVHCLLALQEGRAADARAVARAMATRCGDEARLPAQVRAHTLEAVACWELGDHDGVREALRCAIELASALGLLQPFFEFDAPMLSMLREFQRVQGTELPVAQADFLAGLILRLIATGKAKAYTEPLTSRECDILELLRHGGSNKVIARALDLTENAVKFHLKNVFRKLRVENRAMAAQVAQRLDLGAGR